MNRRLKKSLPMERRMVLIARSNLIARIIPPFGKTPAVRLILKAIMTLAMNRSQMVRMTERKTIF